MKLTIARLGHLGDGIAEGPEGPLFIPGLLPGEEIEGDLQGDRLEGVRILTPSVDRVRPPCSHAKSCGGCLMQHARDSLVEGWKRGIVEGALAGQGLAGRVRGIVTSPPRSRRRAVLSGRRTKGGALIGFHARASQLIIPVPNCQLLHPDLMAAMPALEALVIAGGSRTGELDLMVTASLGGPDVVVTGGKPLDTDLQLQLARIVEAHGLARLTWGDEVVALRASPLQRMGRALVAPPPGAFLQATAEGEAALLDAVREAVGEAARIVDLFAGCGTFTLPLAETADLRAYEGDAAMIAALDRGWRQAPGLHRVTAETRDLFRRPLEPDEFKGVDAVAIDPPRAGAEAQCATLARSDVPVIAMVSCNPVTFARDVRALVQGGYTLDWVQVVDQFRWSAHVELAARLSKL